MENRKEAGARTGSGKIKDFQDLNVWRAARKLRAEIYRVTKTFPREEAHVLVAQMRRAAVSVTANLAEGYGRFSYQENIQFCRHSCGSVYELRDHFTTALDAGTIDQKAYRDLEASAMDVIRLLNGYIRSTKKLQTKTKAAG